MSLNDTGWYTCLVSNALGARHSSGYVSIVEELPVERSFSDEGRVAIGKLWIIGVSIGATFLVMLCSVFACVLYMR